MEFTQVDHEIAVFSEVKGITLCWVNLDCTFSSASCSLIVSRAQRAAADGARSESLAKNGRKYLAGWLERYSFQHFNLQEGLKLEIGISLQRKQ